MFANRFASSPSTPDPVGGPSRMQGNEPLWGYAVAVLLVVVAVLDLTVTTGAGAPKHPTTWTPAAGLVLALVLAGTMRYRSRLLSPFVAIFAAFFVTLSKGPRVLGFPHILALVVAVGFALLVSMRQRKDQKALTPNMTAADRREAADARRRRRKGEPEPPPGPKRPPPSARYTPPKSKTTPKR
jgi:uncharacterized membrane protein YccC